MRAAVFVGVDEPLSVEKLTANDPGPYDAVVRVGASGVCRSDLSLMHGHLPIPPPVILGHEGAGTVESVGNAVSRVQPGDRVIASFVPACGRCFYCVRDKAHLCEHGLDVMAIPKATRDDGTPLTAFSGLGTFSDQMTVHESALVKVETDLPDEQLALIGCGVTTGVGAALNTARVEPGSIVAVVGCGGVGQSVIQGARIAGAARIIAVDPVELKRTAALDFGATDLVDPADGDPIAQVQAITGGRGADFGFEVLGRPETITQAYGMTRRGGTVTIVGMPSWDAQVTMSAFGLFYDEKRLLGCVYGSAQVHRDFPRFVSLAETGRLDLGHMVSRRIALGEVNDAFRAMEAGEVIRSVITDTTR
jgi:S-(hydroxymethyl)glutathione dehydrogenase/alcohol dehydrogenase